MKEFISGLIEKMIFVVLTIVVAVLTVLTFLIVANSLDVHIYVLLTFAAVAALVWQIIETIKEERERKQREKELEELIKRQAERRATKGGDSN